MAKIRAVKTCPNWSGRRLSKVTTELGRNYVAKCAVFLWLKVINLSFLVAFMSIKNSTRVFTDSKSSVISTSSKKYLS